MKTQKESIFKNAGFQSILAAILCIVIGLFIGFLVLLAINPAGAGEAIVTIMRNFLNYPTRPAQMKYLGNTLVKTAPLLMCALSINFCYKVGLFNIGAAGQYVAGAGACLYAALALELPWYICLLCAMVAGGIFGTIVGFLKAYANVNEVIAGIMLNWIGLYLVNMLLAGVKEQASPYTFNLSSTNTAAILPTLSSAGTHSHRARNASAMLIALRSIISRRSGFGKSCFFFSAVTNTPVSLESSSSVFIGENMSRAPFSSVNSGTQPKRASLAAVSAPESPVSPPVT